MPYMSTKAKQASARNGALSKGPKTPVGKAIASRNATKHGIMSRELVLPNENQEEFTALLASLAQELDAQGTLEMMLVERVAISIWRQRRLVRVESAQILIAQQEAQISIMPSASKLCERSNEELIFISLQQEPLASNLDAFERELLQFSATGPMIAFDVFTHRFPLLSKFWPRPDGATTDEYQWVSDAYGNISDTIPQWLAALAITKQQGPSQYLALVAKGIPASAEVLSRYQSALDNELYKALRALREAQATRRRAIDAKAQI